MIRVIILLAVCFTSALEADAQYRSFINSSAIKAQGFFTVNTFIFDQVEEGLGITNDKHVYQMAGAGLVFEQVLFDETSVSFGANFLFSLDDLKNMGYGTLEFRRYVLHFQDGLYYGMYGGVGFANEVTYYTGGLDIGYVARGIDFFFRGGFGRFTTGSGSTYNTKVNGVQAEAGLMFGIPF